MVNLASGRLMIGRFKIRFVIVAFVFIEFTGAILQPHACSSFKFGWQCRYDCDCPGSCNPVTGECDACEGEKWGPGCLLNSSCRYNDPTGRWYQGKCSWVYKVVRGSPYNTTCIPWYPQIDGYSADLFPERDLRKASNYCRDPSRSGYLFCFIKDNPPYRDWERCHQVQPCGCPEGRFGVNCREECHCEEKSNRCYFETGRCPSGCHDRFQGPSCQDCKDGYFGLYCNATCRCFDQAEVCDKTTGRCQHGCASGWSGEDCQTECIPGSYGPSCLNSCSANCKNRQVCDRVNGFCLCKAGFQLPSCENKCPPGTYGMNCTSSCSSGCDGPCDHMNGTCTCRCEYKGPTCSERKIDDSSVQKKTCGIACIIAVVLAILFLLVTGPLIAFFVRSVRKRNSASKAGNLQYDNFSMTVEKEDKQNQTEHAGEGNDGSNGDYYNLASPTYEQLDVQTTRDNQDDEVEGKTYQSLQHK